MACFLAAQIKIEVHFCNFQNPFFMLFVFPSLLMEGNFEIQQRGIGHGWASKFMAIHNTTLQSMMNAKLSKQRF